MDPLQFPPRGIPPMGANILFWGGDPLRKWVMPIFVFCGFSVCLGWVGQPGVADPKGRGLQPPPLKWSHP